MNCIKEKKYDKIMNYIEVVFKFMFLTLTLISFNNCIAKRPILTYFSYLVVGVGAIIIGYRLINFKKHIKVYGIFILVAFVLSYFVSTIINRKYGIVENIQAIIWMVLQFGILYAFDVTKSPEKNRKEIDALLKYFLGYVAFANIVSLIMLFMNYGYPAFLSPTKNDIGFLWGRLWGLYSDPNNGSVFCAVAIIISVYYATATKKKPLKATYIISILLSFAYIMFSDSRTGLVCMVLGVSAFSYLSFNASKKIKTNEFVKQLICISLAVFIAVSSVVALTVTKKGYNFCIEKIYTYQQSKPDNEQPNKPNITIGRDGDELNEDVSNRRFDLWKSGIDIWKCSPIVGTGHRSIVAFAEEHTPNTYLVNNNFSTFNSTHNMIIDILVSQGLLGLIIFAVFITAIIVLIFKKVILKKGQIKNTEIILYLSILIVFATSSMFILDVLYVNTAGSFIFWAVLGQLVHKLTFKSSEQAE